MDLGSLRLLSKARLSWLERMHSRHFDECAELTSKHLRQVGRTWIAAHPKRTLRWVDAMGSHGWLVDGEWLQHSLRLEDERWREVMALLIESHDWYAEVCDELRMGALVSDMEFKWASQNGACGRSS